MPRYSFLKPALRVLLASLSLTIMFGAGLSAGMYFYPRVFTVETEHDDHDHDHDEDADHDHDDHDHEEGDHVALTEQAFGNLQLKMGHAKRGEFWKSILVPAQVVEIPGRSDLAVSAPVAGIVERVFVLPGESLQPQQPLFEIRLTDQSLTDTQAELLTTLTRQEVAEAEIARLAPAVRSGGVAGTKKREREYELRQLRDQQTTLVQVLRGRGLPGALIDSVLKNRELATTLTVFAPDFVRKVGQSLADSSTGYSVEDLHVHPGKAVERGADLCSIAYHLELYIEGTAFEDDLNTLNRIAERNWDITAELHDVHGGHTQHASLDSVKLLRIDNHVDEKTQTVRFYARLPNSVARTHHDQNRAFDQWRFRPGQRLHLRLPVERWQDQWTLPAEAVVIDGPNVMVFAAADEDMHGHATHNETAMGLAAAAVVHGDNDKLHDDHDHDHDVFIEFEPVPVRLLYRDDQTVVIATDGQITQHTEIALNNAQKLYLAMKMQAGGGGGHHHHH